MITVKELIAHLSTFNQDLDVMQTYTDHTDFDYIVPLRLKDVTEDEETKVLIINLDLEDEREEEEPKQY